jgi:hypothetical protein
VSILRLLCAIAVAAVAAFKKGDYATAARLFRTPGGR